jgi:hydrogenase maturation protease
LLSFGPASDSRVRIMGVGSHHGLDSVGWYAVRRLQETGFAGRFPAGQVDLSICDTPVQLPALAQGARLLIIIDALPGGDTPGTLHRLTVADLARMSLPASSHALGLAQMLELIEALPGEYMHTTLIGVDVGSAWNDPDSAARELVDSILEPLANTLDDAIRRFLQSGTTPAT